MADEKTGGKPTPGDKTGDEGTPTPGAKTGGTPDPNIQAVIDGVVARERTRADKALADLKADFETKLADAQKGKAKAGDEDEAFKAKVAAARKPVEAERDAEREARGKLSSRVARAEVLAAAAPVSVAPEDVAESLGRFVRVNAEGVTEVVDAEAKPRYGAKGPMTVAELVAEHLKTRPYLVKSTVRTGGQFQGPGAGGTMTLEDFEKLPADEQRALYDQDPALWKSLMDAKRKRGEARLG